MSAGSRSARKLASANALFRDTVCISCRHRLAHQTRQYAAAAAVAEQPAPTQQEPPNPPVTQTEPRKAYRVLASPVLSRSPILTRDLTSFEKAFYLYQKRLNERLALPFTQYFYFKDRTPGVAEWKRKIRARKTPAKDIGVYSGYGEEAWNDEVLVGDKTSEPESQVEALLRDAEGKDIVESKPVGDGLDGVGVTGDAKAGEGVAKKVGVEGTVPRPEPRVTEADRNGDLKSLSRRLDRSLYLLVKNKEGRWRFPEDRVYGRENLHQAAERVLIQAAGLNMNTWMVGNHPIGHFAHQFIKPKLTQLQPNRLVSTSTEMKEQEEYGEKVFFMKGRIMAGQADLTANEFGDQEFRWLTKEEIEGVVTQGYWGSIGNMLTER